MLLFYKDHAVLIINVHSDDEDYIFRAHIPERLMDEYARQARQWGLMVRRMSA